MLHRKSEDDYILESLQGREQSNGCGICTSVRWKNRLSVESFIRPSAQSAKCRLDIRSKTMRAAAQAEAVPDSVQLCCSMLELCVHVCTISTF